MRTRNITAITTAVAAALTISACSSSARSGSGNQASGNGVTSAAGAPIKLGVLASLTGVGAAGSNTIEDGVKARLGLQNASGGVYGHKLTYVMADSQSSGPGEVAATQKLIEQDHVYGILDDDGFFAAAAATTTTAGIPVAGSSFDGGPEWRDKNASNLFDAVGYGDYSLVATTWGNYFKSVGATKVGAVGYGPLPSSTLAAKAAVASAKAVGLQAGFLDTTLPLGDTNVGPLVQQIKASGTDALYAPVQQDVGYALIRGLQQAGVKMKSVVLATGYGQDVLANPATRAAANGVDFSTLEAPVEVQTAATKRFQEALATYAGVTGIPTFGEYLGWLTADLFIRGLQLAGPNASSKQFIDKLRNSTWDGAGLVAPTNFADIKPAAGGLDQNNCINVVRFSGTQFVPQPGATPVCGTIVKGLTVSGS